LIYIKDNTITLEEAEKLKVFLSHPWRAWEGTAVTNIPHNHELALKIKSVVAHDKNFKEIEAAQIITYPTGISKPFHLDTARKTTTGASITFLNDNFKGGEAVVEGIEITPILGRTYYFDGNMYQHAVLNVIKGSRHTLGLWYNYG